ncbi:MAG TPA: pilus assembly protein TadG-related protein [Paracoccaceae bacterium]|nr:pilus assembly protein TadG-related protein [Paracoccaceae bacterium]
MTRRAHSDAPLPRTALRGARPWQRFKADEEGSLFVFGMVLFILMIMVGGIAVDVMRYEQRRTALQQTTDRAVLAAASLTQDLDPTAVVNDYFDKAQLTDYLRSVTVTEGLNFRNVEADARADLRNFFMQMIGIPEFEVPAISQAEQRINNVEIVMVLDISGSMNTNNKAGNLKTAASEFVDTVLSNDAADRIAVSMVPYNGQVNLGPVLRSKFNVTAHSGTTHVDCVDMPASVYSTETMSRTLAMPATAHADTYSSTSQSTSYVAIQGHTINALGQHSNNWCPPLPNNIVRVMGNDIGVLQAQIQALDVIGATSINAGLRWGLTLIDPAQRPLINELVAEGHVDAAFAGRPFDWTDEEAMKVIILMTDGEHFAEDRVNTAYKSGNAPIWYSSNDNAYAIRHTSGRPSTAGSNEYWYPARNSGAGEWRSGVLSGYTQQTWPQVWARARVQWVAWQLYARALGTSSSTRTSTFNTWMSNFRSQTAIPTMDSQLNQVCNYAKNRRVIIYGIAFEAPANGRAAIESCASSPAHYFNAQGLDIRTAFRAIAANISQLRLTQ